MKKRFNIALIPHTQANKFIAAAEYFYPLAGIYKTGFNSRPHVTLCQFIANDNDAELYWKQACKSLPEQSIVLSFDSIESCTTDSTNWIFMRPNKLDDLMKIHCDIANNIESRIGRCFDNYDAHLTLVNCDEKNYDEMVISYSFEPILDVFILALGESDDMGQLKKVLHFSDK